MEIKDLKNLDIVIFLDSQGVETNVLIYFLDDVMVGVQINCENLVSEGNCWYDRHDLATETILKVYKTNLPYRLIPHYLINFKAEWECVWERTPFIPEYTMSEAVEKMGHEFKIKE